MQFLGDNRKEVTFRSAEESTSNSRRNGRVNSQLTAEREKHQQIAGKLDIYLLGITIVIGGQLVYWHRGLQNGFWLFLLSNFLVGGGYVCLTLCLAEMTSFLPFSGGSYGYVRCAMGPVAGFLVGICETIEYVLYVTSAVLELGNLLTVILGLSPVYEPLYWLGFFIISFLIQTSSSKFFWRFNKFISCITLLLILFYICVSIPLLNISRYAQDRYQVSYGQSSFAGAIINSSAHEVFPNSFSPIISDVGHSLRGNPSSQSELKYDFEAFADKYIDSKSVATPYSTWADTPITITNDKTKADTLSTNMTAGREDKPSESAITANIFASTHGTEFFFYFPLSSWFYVGVEVMTLSCNDVDLRESAAKIVPQAMVACMITLLVSSMAIMIISSFQHPGSLALVNELLPLNPGYSNALNLSPRITTILAIPGTFATAFGFMFAYGRQIYSMSSSGLIPDFLTQVYGKNEVPTFALFFGSVLSYLSLLFLWYIYPGISRQVFNICILGSSVVYVALFRSYLICANRYSSLPRRYRNIGGRISAYYGIAVFILMIISLVFFQHDNYISVMVFICFIVLSLLYYFLQVKGREYFSEEEQTKFMKAYIVNANESRRRSAKQNHQQQQQQLQTQQQLTVQSPQQTSRKKKKKSAYISPAYLTASTSVISGSTTEPQQPQLKSIDLNPFQSSQRRQPRYQLFHFEGKLVDLIETDTHIFQIL